MNNKVLLVIAGLLILIGVVRPDLSRWNGPVINNNEIVVITPPSDQALKDACAAVTASLQSGGSSRIADGKRLANLYMDLATLVELDGEDLVVKNTDEVRSANSLCGVMLRMDIKGKYPKLASNSNAVIVAGIGDDNVPLDSKLRAKAVESFRALGWACLEGTK